MNLTAEGRYHFSVDSRLILGQFVSKKKQLCLCITHLFERRKEFSYACFQRSQAGVWHDSFRPLVSSLFNNKSPIFQSDMGEKLNLLCGLLEHLKFTLDTFFFKFTCMLMTPKKKCRQPGNESA